MPPSLRLPWSLALLLGAGLALAADAPFTWPEPGTAAPLDPTSLLAPQWTAWGGRATLRFDAHLLAPYGAEISVAGAAQSTSGDLHLPIREQGGLEFKIGGTQFQGFVEGHWQLRGALKIRAGKRELILQDLKLVPRASNSWDLDVVDADGTVWFVNDHVHYQISPDRTQIELFNMDLRATPALAKWLGDSNVEGHRLGGMAVSSAVRVDGDVSKSLKSCTAPNWPNSANPGGPWRADVMLNDMSSIDLMNCVNCVGEGAGTGGQVVFAPNATLVNSSALNDPNTPFNAAEVPWYFKFSGYRPPYNNDQHPFLIWNLYRQNSDGTVDQIGRSGIKHAFLTINFGCADPTCGSIDGSILGRGCGDVYSSGNNDEGNALGPRSEVVPARGIWGRCGSIYDANCDHSPTNPSDPLQMRDRMVVTESQIRASANPGARYFMESWYVVRDDINIYNTMGYREVQPGFGGTWQMANVGAFTQGPFINSWVDPALPVANRANAEITSSEGKARVAVRASYRGNGVWRYDYAVMNLDYSRPQMQLQPVAGNPSAEVYRVTRNFGFSAFEVARVAGSSATAVRFSDGDNESQNQWVGSVNAGNVRWAGAESSALNWGSLYAFSIESDTAPGPANATLNVLDAGSPAQFAASVIGPTGAVGGLFEDGLE